MLGPGTRLDNLVQVGHNVRAGRGCILVAQSGVSGSTTLGDFVTVAAQAGLTGHLRIGSKARIGAQAGVMDDVPAGTDVLGSPAMAGAAHLARHGPAPQDRARREGENGLRAMDGNGENAAAKEERSGAATVESFDIAQIMRAIPHRYPFLLVDRMVDVVKGVSAIGVKNVSINENFFQGHFPDHPVMPGVLIIECMAQTAAVLVVETLGPEAARQARVLHEHRRARSSAGPSAPATRCASTSSRSASAATSGSSAATPRWTARSWRKPPTPP